MPLIGFTVFKNKILDGSKRQTIRVLRKKPIKVGDKLYLYWHLRQKDCEHLKTVICTETFLIQMQFIKDWMHSDPKWRVHWIRPNRNMALQTMANLIVEDLAKRDGFENTLDMLVWFDKHYRHLDWKIFQVIRW